MILTKLKFNNKITRLTTNQKIKLRVQYFNYLIYQPSLLNHSVSRTTLLPLSSTPVVIKKTLMRAVANNVAQTYIPKSPNITTPIIRQKSCLAFRPKSINGIKYSNDGGKGHTSRMGIHCDKSDCENKECKTPCGDITEVTNEGNFTHNPPKGSNSVNLGQTDFVGNTTTKGQHFVKTDPNNKPTISPEELKNLTEDDLLPNKAADIFSTNMDLFNKLK